MGKRSIIEIDEQLCNGCGQCVPSCHEGAIQIINGKAKLVSDKFCDGLGACLGHCPTGALKVIEREADEFDEEAVKSRLAQLAALRAPSGGGCPSAQVRQRMPQGTSAGAEVAAESALETWPVQITLVPPTAPFLQGAHLLVAADCVPFAYARFHPDFLSGRVLLVGCPKLDDVGAYAAKFADIFAANVVASVTVVVMQVPCCQGLPMVVQRGMALAGTETPVEKVVISLDGKVLSRQTL